ncbi:hypothetical protein AB0G35_25525 [Streptomyces sp. NPDC021749]
MAISEMSPTTAAEGTERSVPPGAARMARELGSRPCGVPYGAVTLL